MKCSRKTLYLLVIVLALVYLEVASARGGRGSGRSGGRSSYGRSSSSRYGSRSGSRYTGYVAAAGAGYAIHGMTRYRSRYYGTSHYRSEPDICYTNSPGKYDNGTYTSSLKYFVCPYKSTDAISDTYCCGTSDQQTCCGFWDNGGRMAGAIIGIVLGVLLLVVIIGCCVRQCTKGYNNGRTPTKTSSSVTATYNRADHSVDYNNYPSMPQPYGQGVPQASYPSGPQASYPSGPQASYPSGPQASYPSGQAPPYQTNYPPFSTNPPDYPVKPV